MIKILLILVNFVILAVSCDRVFDPYPLKTEVFYDPKLPDEANQKITILLNGIECPIKLNFTRKYDNWKNTWDDDAYLPCSNPRCWTQSNQYAELINYCKENGRKIWVLVFKSHLENEKEYLTSLLIEDLTFQEYGYFADEIRTDIEKSENKNFDDFWIVYIQKVLRFL